jgi:hypothetical protein
MGCMPTSPASAALPRRAALLLGAGTLLWGGAGSASAQASTGTLRLSGAADANDRRYIYAKELLLLALSRAESPLKVVQIGGMTQTRMAVEVAEGRMDVLLLPMSWPPNAAIMPVRVPLRRGLLGVRLLLTRPELAQAIAACNTIEQLRTRFVMGYGADWIDRPAFEPLGFRVVSGSSYSGLFDMLRAGRFDFFSRGVNEIWPEVDHPVLGKGLVVAPRIALSYPLDDYLWVRRGDTALHDLITLGLARARADGSMDKLFDQWFGQGLRRAALDQRQVLELGGYPVEPGTPLELFDVLATLKHTRVGR